MSKNLNSDRLKFFIEHPEFEKIPVSSFTEFIDNPNYLGIGADIYQVIRVEGEKIWKGILSEQYTEGVALWGIGSGKSLLSEVLSCLFVHWLLCLENPHKYFKIAKDKPIVVMNMGTTATQAKNVIFSGIKTMIENSPFFKSFNPEVLATEIRFPQKNISIICGNSQETAPIGQNILFATLDEAAWYLDTNDKSVAENIYSVMRNRIVSRFGNKGFMFVISAPRYVDDFITRLYEKAQTLTNMYWSSFKTWEVKDKEKMSSETFEFDAGNGEIWIVPIDFRNSARENPEKFMRDFGARPSMVLEAFDRDSDIIDRNCNIVRESPVDDKGRFKEWFKGDSRPRFIHIDLALKKDACGFAMATTNGTTTINEEKTWKVYIDLMMQIKAPTNGEIQFSEVRQIIYTLQDRGFNIKLVTFDGWQSADSIQILKARRIESEILSVDRDLGPYDTLKSLLHVGALDYYKFEPFQKEYKTLELIKGKKVDHPAEKGKDVSDAVAGATFDVVKFGGKPEPRIR